VNHMPARDSLDRLVAEIGGVVRAGGPDLPRRVAEALGTYATDPFLLLGHDCPCCPERYVRHLLHEDLEQGWAMAALVWRPGQMSPVHAHKAWCAVGFVHGALAETFYAPGDPPAPQAMVLRRPGDVSFGAADPTQIHRLANLGTETALSIHAYGLPYARFCTELNTILAA